MLPFPSLLICILQEPAAGELWLAVTRSGQRVESVQRPAGGDVAVRTPFGTFHTGHDPVEVSRDGAAEREALTALRQKEGFRFQDWLAPVAEGGFLSELVEGGNSLLPDLSEEEQIELARALESWGARLDPVPEDVAQDKRKDWLWDQVRKADPARALLLGGRLVEEVQASQGQDSQDGLSYSDISRGLRHQEPAAQRAAARCAGKQRIFDIVVTERLFLRSLEGEPLGADGAAEAIARIVPEDARYYWAEGLLRAEESMRRLAARNLGRYGGEHGAAPLVLALSARGRRPPERWKVGEREMAAVVDRHKPRAPQRDEELGQWPYDPLDHSSVIKIVPVDGALAAEVRQALAALAPTLSERSDQSWIDWYAEQKDPWPQLPK
ncbi:MAG: hypothetical protein EYC70_02090 [Planctomycetota bacterium]|nr:MAG: hypothetical protein EYC70_02090 [Planctomycetota bacterium]